MYNHIMYADNVCLVALTGATIQNRLDVCRNFGTSEYLNKKLIIILHAFVTTRLDYLNIILYGMPDYIIQRLLILLNTAVRIVTNHKISIISLMQ